MLQRTILRASRQAAPRTTHIFRQPLVSTRVVAPQAVRWYSDSPAASKEGDSASAAEQKTEAAPAANDEAAKLKADVEKKDKEIIELKVCLAHDFDLPLRSRAIWYLAEKIANSTTS